MKICTKYTADDKGCQLLLRNLVWSHKSKKYALCRLIQTIHIHENAENHGRLEFVSLESMVPQDHLLRKIDEAIDFQKIYEFVEDLYCEDNGRPSIDPVVLFKIVLIQHIYGIPSLRRNLEEVSMNLACRFPFSAFLFPSKNLLWLNCHSRFFYKLKGTAAK